MKRSFSRLVSLFSIGCLALSATAAVPDFPDPQFEDVNGDGIDGDESRAIFVAASFGNDAAPGTKAQPVQTLPRAIELAAADPLKKQVYVAAGTYTLAQPLTVPSGVSLFGKYDGTPAWGRGAAHVSRIQGAATAVLLQNITDETRIEGFEIIAAAATAPGESSYGIRVVGSADLVIIAHNSITAGTGAAGMGGGPGGQGSQGGNGAPGGPGAGDGTASNNQGGSGGTSLCARNGGAGGAGGYSTARGSDGSQGAGGTPGGFGGVSGSVGGAGGSGSGGAPGASGAHGGAGSFGSVTGGMWEPAAGAMGVPGTFGNGGGGGGGGGGQFGTFVIDGAGNGGGGGGAGGCGGDGGLGGGGGGGSFGIFAPVGGITLVRNTIAASQGGAGGEGGAGGFGGGGGSGGPGGNVATSEVGRGGNGGPGGAGGRGGHGGGGAGGVSIAVFAPNGSPQLAGNSLSTLSGGAGGPSPGNAGAAGVSRNVEGSSREISLVSISDAAIDRTRQKAVFTISASPGNPSVTVSYTTHDGSATAGADYTAASGTITVPAAGATLEIDITIPAASQAARTFYVQISAAPDAGAAVEDATGAAVLSAFGSASAVLYTATRAGGSLVPGTADGARLTSFGIPAINGSGDVAFAATTRSDAGAGKVIIAADVLVASAGQTAPEIEGARFKHFTDPALNDSNQIAFLAKLAGVPKSGNEALYATGGGALALVARKGSSAPGVPGATLSKVLAFSLTEDALFFTGLMKGSVSAADNLALWSWTPAQGATLLLRKGQQFDGRTVKTFAVLQPVKGLPGQHRSVNGDGAVARVTFDDGAKGLLIAKLEGAPVLEVVSGSGAPGGNGATFGDFGAPAITEAGELAFMARLSGVAASEDAAVFSGAADSLLRRFGKGDAAPGLPELTLKAVGDPLVNEERAVAAFVTLGGKGVAKASSRAIIHDRAAAAPALVARAGDPPPGFGSAIRWRSFTALALPDGQGPLFVARLAGRVTKADDVSLWTTSESGALRLVVRENDEVQVGQETKRLRTFSALSPVRNSPEQTRSFSRNGQLVYRATFTDRSQALIRIDLR